jgi:hypothetical protein
MAIIYYPQGSKIIERNTIAGNQVVEVLNVEPNSIFYFGSGSVTSNTSSVISASYANTINQSQIGPITITDPTNVATLNLMGNPSMGGHTSTIEANPSGLTLDVQSGDFISIGGNLQIGNNNIVSNTGKFLGTASYAATSSRVVNAVITMPPNYPDGPAININGEMKSSASINSTRGFGIITALSPFEVISVIIDEQQNIYGNSVYSTGGFTGSLNGNADTATSASSIPADVLINNSATVGDNAILTYNQLTFTDTGASFTNNGISFPDGGFIMLYGGGVTGSLQGTASYAKKALSASYAPTVGLTATKYFTSGSAWATMSIANGLITSII